MKGPQPPNSGSSAEEPEATIIVAASGGDYTTINAACAAAGAGDIIEARAATLGGTFNDATAVTITNSGGTNNRIVVRGRTGDTVKITGSAGGTGNDSYGVRITGNWWDFGQNILIEGDALPNASNIARGVRIGGSNNIIRASATKCNLHAVWIEAGINNVVRDGYSYICGGLDDGDPTGPNDYGDVLEFQVAGATPGTIYKRAGCSGGHGILGMQSADGIFISHVRGENLWSEESDLRHSGVTTDGNRVSTMAQNCKNMVLEDFVYGPIGEPYEADNTQIIRCSGDYFRVRRGLLIGNRSGGPAINTNCPNGQVARYLYYIYLTLTDNDGSGLYTVGPGASNDTATWHDHVFYNCLFWNNCLNPQSTPLGFQIRMIYDGADQHWSDVLKLYGCAFPTGSTFRFTNGRNNANEDVTLAFMEANYPASYANNILISDPLFVDDTMPRVTRQAVFDMSMISTPYANFRPQNSALNASGVSITQVNGAVDNNTTVVVDNARPFHAGDFSDTVPGDTIFIEGFGVAIITNITGTTTLTVDRAVTCADNAEVFLGGSGSPSIGWYQSAGYYG